MNALAIALWITDVRLVFTLALFLWAAYMWFIGKALLP